jgi:PAS domain S-box-containing protein
MQQPAGDSGLARRISPIVETIREVIFEIDSDSRWAFLNPAWNSYTGFQTVETIGRPVLDWMNRHNAAAIPAISFVSSEATSLSCEARS